MPKVSVITPCFNQGAFLDAAIESVLRQSFQDFEILVINDGSTDPATVARLRAGRWPQTTVVHTPNRGLAAARNLGVQMAGGTYLQFLDADDLLAPTKLAVQVRLLEETPAWGFVYSQYQCFDTDPRRGTGRYSHLTLSEAFLDDILFKWERGLSIPIHTVLFRRAVWQGRPPFQETLHAKEDWVMWAELALRGVRFGLVDQELALYRAHPASMTMNVERMAQNYLRAVCYLYGRLSEPLRERFLEASVAHLGDKYLRDVREDLRSRFRRAPEFRVGKPLVVPFRLLGQWWGRLRRAAGGTGGPGL